MLLSLTPSVCAAGSVAVLGGDEDMQENICTQHISSEAFRCSRCSTLCSSQLKLQEHLLSCHVETRQEQESREEEQASTSDTVTSTSHRRTDEDEIIMSRSWLTACGVKCVLYLSSFEAHQDDGGVQFVQLRCILGGFAAFTFQTKLNQRI